MKGIEDVIPKNASQIENASPKCKLKKDSLKPKMYILENLPISC